MTILHQRVPILVLAYNRPRTLKRQLDRIEQLKERDISISVDGHQNYLDEPIVQTVRLIAQKWATVSKHRVRLRFSTPNLGLHGHFKNAFEDFFTENSRGAVLEDDIEFRPSFIDFLDSSNKFQDYWSLAGHRPNDNSVLQAKAQIDFSETNIHTVWGWAASSSSIESYLSLYSSNKRVATSMSAIESIAAEVTRDPFFRNAFRATWRRKILRADKGGGGWDNWWVVTGWNSGKYSLMPNQSLSREELLQDEGQSHSHKSLGLDWNLYSSEQVSKSIKPLDRKCDQELLDVWGIRRGYSWKYAGRLARELKTL